MPRHSADSQIATLIKESKDALAEAKRGTAATRKQKAIARLQQLGLLNKRGQLVATFR